jgi:hypothetical protein
MMYFWNIIEVSIGNLTHQSNASAKLDILASKGILINKTMFVPS